MAQGEPDGHPGSTEADLALLGLDKYDLIGADLTEADLKRDKAHVTDRRSDERSVSATALRISLEVPLDGMA